jgi:hypothetical protein
MLIIIWSGNKDAPVSAFSGDWASNNWYGMRNRNHREGFRFIIWDSEHTMLKEDLEINRIGPFPAGNEFSSSNPQYVWQRCLENEEFRMKVADRIHRHFFNHGLLEPDQLKALFDHRVDQIKNAVVCESARWGDSQAPNIAGKSTPGRFPLTRDVHWLKVVNYTRNEYLSQRSDIVMAQLFAKGLYPDVTAPVPSFTGEGGAAQLALSAGKGIIIFTIDGSDPRMIGGKRNASATTYQKPIPKPGEFQMLKTRTFYEGEWSALLEIEF